MSMLKILAMDDGGLIGVVLRRDVFIVAVSPGSNTGSRGKADIEKFFFPRRWIFAFNLSGFRKPIDFNRLFVDIDTCFDCDEFGRYTGSTVGGDAVVGSIVASDGETC